MKQIFGTEEKFDLNEATKQIVSTTFNFNDTPLERLTETNSDWFFITYNSFNYYYMGLT